MHGFFHFLIFGLLYPVGIGLVVAAALDPKVTNSAPMWGWVAFAFAQLVFNAGRRE